jgi:hypothetical protein
MTELVESSTAEKITEPLPSAAEGQPRLLHVACPEGHKLDAPCTLDGQEVVCPYCSTTFLFSYQDSDEYLAEHSGWQPGPSRRKTGVAGWFTVAVGAAVLALAARYFLPGDLLPVISR